MSPDVETMEMQKPDQQRDGPVALTIAGTDPSGGAGIYADLQVFRDRGCHGTAAITAVVWQNTQGVRGWRAMEAEELRAQLEAVSDDFAVGAVKIGMLPTVGLVEVVGGFLTELDPAVSVIFDPVMTSGDGRSPLMEESGKQGLAVLKDRVDLITPNAPEARALIGGGGADLSPTQLVERLLADGWRRVLLTGGHFTTEESSSVVDWMGNAQGVEELEGHKAVPWDVRGTGCQLSSAIAAERAHDVPWRRAVAIGRTYLNRMLKQNARHVGAGRPVVVRKEPRQ